MFSRMSITKSTENYSDNIKRLRYALDSADAVVIGAGAGLSTSAGYTYTGERFEKYFSDFAAKYYFKDMYAGGFYPYETAEEHWAYWSRYIYINRYMNPPRPVYDRLFELVQDKDYFVLTTNVDHCFQKSGFAKHRLFYTQGDYGLFQCSQPCNISTYENKDVIFKMVEAQGYIINEDGTLFLPDGAVPEMSVPKELVPYCPRCGKPMTMNLRADDTFVEDEGWHLTAERYNSFLRAIQGQYVLFLELGVGYNTPGIVKFSFWRMTAANPQATYACVNYGEAVCPEEIAGRSIVINADIGEVVSALFDKTDCSDEL